MFNKEIKEGNKIMTQNKRLSELTKHYLKMIQMELLEMKTNNWNDKFNRQVKQQTHRDEEVIRKMEVGLKKLHRVWQQWKKKKRKENMRG